MQGASPVMADPIRASIMDIVEGRPFGHEPARLAPSVAIIHKHHRTRREWQLTQHLARRVESGQPIGDIVAELVALEAGTVAPGTSKPLAAYQVDHAATVAMTWLEVDALRPPFVIDGFLRRGELMLLGAESKSRKSWLAQDAALCVAGGFPWHADGNGNGGFGTAQARAHIIDLELAQSECRFDHGDAETLCQLDTGRCADRRSLP